VEHVQRVHREISLDYGSPRVYRELKADGVGGCLNTVAKVMKDAGLRARTKRKFRVVTTDSKHDLPIAPNLLQQDFQAERPNLVWLTDITYVDTLEGFSYLCTVEDLCSRRIVGWATSRTMTAQLVLDALQQAIDLRAPQPGLIVHSDRGSQFASLEYQQRLARYGFRQSMSGRGNCYDNAPMESFFRSYKVEEVYWAQYETHEQATRGVIDYIDRFYNRIRRHSSLGYVSPIEFEQSQLFESKQVG
jgi:transposase InsO family protein